MQLNINDIEMPKRALNINQANFKDEKSIYKGNGFCDVKLVTYNGVQYALKTIHKNMIPQKSLIFEYRRIFNQITNLYSLFHKNIIKLMWHYEQNDNILLLFEFGGGKLYTLLKKKKLSQEEIKLLVKQICVGLQVIHQQGIVHRDITSDNIVVNRQMQLKIIDFGYSKDMMGGRQTQLGSQQYMAPQIFKKQIYNYKVDLWSLGILVYEMFHKRNPFCDGFSEFNENEFINRRDNLQYKIDQKISQDASNFIRSLIVLDPSRRLEIVQLLKHPWMIGKENEDEIFVKEDNHHKKTYKNFGKDKEILPALLKNQSHQSIEESQIKKMENELKYVIQCYSLALIRKKAIISQMLELQSRQLNL